MLSKINQTQKDKFFICQAPRGTEIRLVLVRSLAGGNGEMLVRGYKLPVIRRLSSRDLIHMVTVVNNTVLYT